MNDSSESQLSEDPKSETTVLYVTQLLGNLVPVYVWKFKLCGLAIQNSILRGLRDYVRTTVHDEPNTQQRTTTISKNDESNQEVQHGEALMHDSSDSQLSKDHKSETTVPCVTHLLGNFAPVYVWRFTLYGLTIQTLVFRRVRDYVSATAHDEPNAQQRTSTISKQKGTDHDEQHGEVLIHDSSDSQLGENQNSENTVLCVTHLLSNLVSVYAWKFMLCGQMIQTLVFRGARDYVGTTVHGNPKMHQKPFTEPNNHTSNNKALIHTSSKSQLSEDQSSENTVLYVTNSLGNLAPVYVWSQTLCGQMIPTLVLRGIRDYVGATRASSRHREGASQHQW